MRRLRMSLAVVALLGSSLVLAFQPAGAQDDQNESPAAEAVPESDVPAEEAPAEETPVATDAPAEEPPAAGEENELTEEGEEGEESETPSEGEGAPTDGAVPPAPESEGGETPDAEETPDPGIPPAEGGEPEAGDPGDEPDPVDDNIPAAPEEDDPEAGDDAGEGDGAEEEAPTRAPTPLPEPLELTEDTVALTPLEDTEDDTSWFPPSLTCSSAFAWTNTFSDSTGPDGVPDGIPEPGFRLVNGIVQGGAQSGASSFSTGVSLPPGTYDIPQAISWDGYPSRAQTEVQTSEIWALQFIDAEGGVIVTTGYTGDGIDDGITADSWVGPLGTVELPDGAANVRIIHGGAGPSFNSVSPAGFCLVPQNAEPASIGSFVWKDLNRNGLQDAGEPGVDAVEVELWTANEDGTPNERIDAQITGESGTYFFDGLDPDLDWLVRFIPDAEEECVLTVANAGDDALDSDADQATGWTGVIELDPGEVDNSIDAGFIATNDASIDLEKSTGTSADNGVDADTADLAVDIAPGQTVVWTYVVTNTGLVTLNDVTVNDDREGLICTLASLSAGESATCTKTGIAGDGLYANVGTATGQPVDAEGNPSELTPPTATDPSHYMGITPAVLGFTIGCATNPDGAVVNLTNSMSTAMVVSIVLNGNAVGGAVTVPANGQIDVFVPVAAGSSAQIQVFEGDTLVGGAQFTHTCSVAPPAPTPEPTPEVLPRVQLAVTGLNTYELAAAGIFIISLGVLLLDARRRFSALGW